MYGAGEFDEGAARKLAFELMTLVLEKGELAAENQRRESGPQLRYDRLTEALRQFGHAIAVDVRNELR